jgi:Fe-S-cluster containining protein
MSDKGIRTTEELGKLIKEWSPVKHDVILNMIGERTEQFRSAYREGGLIEFVKTFYDLFDETLAEATRTDLLSCGKGCHVCCRQNVTVWEGEAAVIAEYCKEHGINIPKGYLEEQLKYGWKEVASSEVAWCTFLKDGLCSIYPVRPLACRKYLVVSHPEKCDVVKFPPPNNLVAVAIYAMPEIEASAFYGVMADQSKCGRLPEMLLLYSK